MRKINKNRKFCELFIVWFWNLPKTPAISLTSWSCAAVHQRERAQAHGIQGGRGGVEANEAQKHLAWRVGVEATAAKKPIKSQERTEEVSYSAEFSFKCWDWTGEDGTFFDGHLEFSSKNTELNWAVLKTLCRPFIQFGQYDFPQWNVIVPKIWDTTTRMIYQLYFSIYGGFLNWGYQ